MGTPEGYNTVTPYITVSKGKEAIRFYEEAFGAELKTVMEMPGGKLAHAEIKIGDSVIMIGEENPSWGNVSPATLGGTPCGMMIYVDDVDASFKRAIEAGAVEEMAVEDQFYGDRSGQVKDPFGHKWTLSTQIEQLTDDEVRDRFDEWMAAQA